MKIVAAAILPVLLLAAACKPATTSDKELAALPTAFTKVALTKVVPTINMWILRDEGTGCEWILASGEGRALVPRNERGVDGQPKQRCTTMPPPTAGNAAPAAP